jgi:hypothetical protein
LPRSATFSSRANRLRADGSGPHERLSRNPICESTFHIHDGQRFSGVPSATDSAICAAVLWAMGTKSRESIYGSSVRASSERAAEAREEADRLACEAWNQHMLGFQGPAQPSPTSGDALNTGYLCLEVKCLSCETHQTVC